MCVCVCFIAGLMEKQIWKNGWQKFSQVLHSAKKTLPRKQSMVKVLRIVLGLLTAGFAENKAWRRCHTLCSRYSLQALPSLETRILAKRARWGLPGDEFTEWMLLANYRTRESLFAESHLRLVLGVPACPHGVLACVWLRRVHDFCTRQRFVPRGEHHFRSARPMPFSAEYPS